MLILFIWLVVNFWFISEFSPLKEKRIKNSTHFLERKVNYILKFNKSGIVVSMLFVESAHNEGIRPIGPIHLLGSNPSNVLASPYRAIASRGGKPSLCEFLPFARILVSFSCSKWFFIEKVMKLSLSSFNFGMDSP